MLDSVINRAVRQCGLCWRATLLCKLTDYEYPFTGAASYVLGYVSFAVSSNAYIRHIKE
jgi:hypothetical protein